MLLQTNSYVVPKEKRAEHARLVRKFRQTLLRLGCDQFDVFEQVTDNWGGGETTGRFVQMMRFRDRRHQQSVQAAEKQDAAAQQLIAEFCELINFAYQRQQGLFGVGFYQSVLPVAPMRLQADVVDTVEAPEDAAAEVELEDTSAAGTEDGLEPDPGLRIVEEAGGESPSEPADASNNGERNPTPD
jgi:hypothetical protein